MTMRSAGSLSKAAVMASEKAWSSLKSRFRTIAIGIPASRAMVTPRTLERELMTRVI